MRFRQLRPTVTALLLLAASQAAESQAPGSLLRTGQAYEIRLERTSNTSGGSSTGSSYDEWTLVERVIAVRDGGAELEFDLPADTSADARGREWRYPARVFVSSTQAMELLNRPDLQKRIAAWLGDQDPKVCGHWVFTWTAYRIECDPQSVLEVLGSYLAPGGLNDGAPYMEPGAKAPARLHSEPGASGGLVFKAELEVDGAAALLKDAETQSALAELTGKSSPAMDAVIRARAAKAISGAIAVTIETANDGRVTRRMRNADTDTRRADGSVEHESVKETTTWTPVSWPAVSH